MSLLVDVVDQDFLVSTNPLAFDLSGGSTVRGAPAILRRVLYLWCIYLGTYRQAPDLGMTAPLTDLQGSTYSPRDLAGLKSALESQAQLVDFVDAATVTLTLSDAGTLIVSAVIALTDNKSYALEVSIAGARIVLLTLGSQT